MYKMEYLKLDTFAATVLLAGVVLVTNTASAAGIQYVSTQSQPTQYSAAYAVSNAPTLGSLPAYLQVCNFTEAKHPYADEDCGGDPVTWNAMEEVEDYILDCRFMPFRPTYSEHVIIGDYDLYDPTGNSYWKYNHCLDSLDDPDCLSASDIEDYAHALKQHLLDNAPLDSTGLKKKRIVDLNIYYDAVLCGCNSSCYTPGSDPTVDPSIATEWWSYEVTYARVETAPLWQVYRPRYHL